MKIDVVSQSEGDGASASAHARPPVASLDNVAQRYAKSEVAVVEAQWLPMRIWVKCDQVSTPLQPLQCSLEQPPADHAVACAICDPAAQSADISHADRSFTNEG